CEGPISPHDREELKNLIIALDNWRVMAYENIIPESDVLEGLRFKVKKGKKFQLEKKKLLNPFTLKWEHYYKIVLANDRESRNFIQKMRISLAVDLLLYDSFFRLANVLKKAKKIRSILEYDMPEQG